MVEVIKHALGLCGEHYHPNLWTVLIGGFGIGTTIKFAISYCKCKIKSIFTKSKKKIIVGHNFNQYGIDEKRGLRL